jgi:hypothetical protein
VPATEHFCVGGARVWRVVQHYEDKVYIRWDVFEFGGQPVALRAGSFIL